MYIVCIVKIVLDIFSNFYLIQFNSKLFKCWLIRNMHSWNAPRWVVSVCKKFIKNFMFFNIRLFPPGNPACSEQVQALISVVVCYLFFGHACFSSFSVFGGFKSGKFIRKSYSRILKIFFLNIRSGAENV